MAIGAGGSASACGGGCAPRVSSVTTRPADDGGLWQADWSTARGYLAEERQALREAARVTGLDVVTLHAVAESPLAAATDQDVSEAVGKLPASTLQRFGLVVSTN